MTSSSPRPASVDAQNPWPGLESFYEGDKTFFHGRGAETEELFDLVQRRRLTILHGLSGLGKSSLLRAGLFPELRDAGFLPVLVRLDFTDRRRALRSQVLRAIEDAVPEAFEAPDLARSESLWEAFHQVGSRFWDARNRPLVPVLVFDQFEEIFTLGRGDASIEADAREFLVELADLVEGRAPARVRDALSEAPDAAAEFDFTRHDYKVVLALREDYLADLDDLRESMPSVALNRMRLLGMNGEKALDVVRLPAGNLVDEDTAARIVRFVAGGDQDQERELRALQVEPALLSLTCRELNEARKRAPGAASERISLELVDGAAGDILDGFYERGVSDLTPEARRFVEDELITVSGHRDSVDLDNALQVTGLDETVLQLLEDRRLVRREERGGRVRLELTHDVLARPVRRSRAVREEREAAEAEEVARVAAEAAQADAERRAEEAAKREKEAAERETVVGELLRRTQFFGLIMTVLVLIAGGLTWWALASQRQATDAAQLANYNLAQLYESRATDALSRIEQSGTAAFRDAFLYSLAAIAEDIGDRRLPVTQDRLRFGGLERAFAQMSPSLGVPVEITSLAWGPDGTSLAAGDGDGTVRIWDMTSGAPIAELRGGADAGDAIGVSWSPDGRSLAWAGGEGLVQVWEPESGRVTTSLSDTVEVLSLAWSPDGRSLATSNDAGIVLVWDVDNGILAASLRGDSAESRTDIEAVAWSPDGRSLAIGDDDGVLRVWEIGVGVDTTSALARTGASEALSSISWRPDAGVLAVGSSDGMIRIWEIEGGAIVDSLLAHSGAVTSVRWRPDGLAIASAGRDGLARVWDLRGDDNVVSMRGHVGTVRSVTWRPDGTALATGGTDGSIRIWDPGQGVERAGLAGLEERAVDVAWSPDGRFVASGHIDGTVKIREAARDLGTQMSRGHFGGVRDVTWSPDGAYLASTAASRAVRVWDVDSGTETTTLPRSDGVLTVEWSSDQRFLASTARDSTVRVWEIDSDGRAATLLHNEEGRRLQWSPAGGLLAIGSFGGEVRLWDPDPEVDAVQLGGHSDAVNGLAWSDDGSSLASVGADSSVLVWDVVTGTQTAEHLELAHDVVSVAWELAGRSLLLSGSDGTVRTWFVGATSTRELHSGVADVTWSPDRRFGASADADGTIRVLAEANETVAVLVGNAGAVSALSWSPDGRSLASGASGGVRIWDTKIEPEALEVPSDTEGVFSLSWNPDGRTVAAGYGDGMVRLWDPAADSVVATLEGDSDQIVFSAEWNHEGRVLAVASAELFGSDAMLRLWTPGDTAGTDTLTSLSGQPVGVSWSADGASLAVGYYDDDDGSLRLWDVASGDSTATLPHGASVTGVRHSPDGRSLATADDEGLVRVWDLGSRSVSRRMGGGLSESYSVVWSPDGRFLASGGDQGDISIWDAQAGLETGRLEGHDDSVIVVSWSPDGRLVSGGEDGTLRFWDVESMAETVRLDPGWGFPAVARSPDGRSLAFGSEDGTLRVLRDRFEPLEPLAAEGRTQEVLEAALYFFGSSLNEFELQARRPAPYFTGRGGFEFPGSRPYEMFDRPRPIDVDPIQWLIDAVEAEAARVRGR